MKTKRKFNVFRIIESQIPKGISKKAQSNQIQLKTQEINEITSQIIKNNKYIYFDLTAQNSMKLMQKQQNPQTQDQQCAQQYGDSFVTNLEKRSKGSNQMNKYLTSLITTSKRKQSIRENIKQRLNKIRKEKSYDISQNYTKNYKQSFKQYLFQKKFEQLSQELTNREHHVIKKLGIQNNYDFLSKSKLIKNSSPKRPATTSLTTTTLQSTCNSIRKNSKHQRQRELPIIDIQKLENVNKKIQGNLLILGLKKSKTGKFYT